MLPTNCRIELQSFPHPWQHCRFDLKLPLILVACHSCAIKKTREVSDTIAVERNKLPWRKWRTLRKIDPLDVRIMHERRKYVLSTAGTISYVKNTEAGMSCSDGIADDINFVFAAAGVCSCTYARLLPVFYCPQLASYR